MLCIGSYVFGLSVVADLVLFSLLHSWLVSDYVFICVLLSCCMNDFKVRRWLLNSTDFLVPRSLAGWRTEAKLGAVF
jgi:hypothetical protein